jgi:hypothetical protein
MTYQNRWLPISMSMNMSQRLELSDNIKFMTLPSCKTLIVVNLRKD